MIRRFAEQARHTPNPRILHDIGDDCAVIAVGDRVLLASCDATVEGIHFRRDLAKPEDIGWKAAASALSDIAAMGGRPLYMLVTLSFAPGESADYVSRVFDGIAAAANAHETPIVGGDTTSSPGPMFIDINVAGEAQPGLYRTRAGAKSGDLLAVTGNPGNSPGGLQALLHRRDSQKLIRAHLHPEPRIAQGLWLARHDGVRAMIDISDGIAQDAGHLAEAAGLGINIEKALLPLSKALHMFCGDDEAANLALTGGEDYELAVALAPDSAEDICAAFWREFALTLTPVGIFTDAHPQVLLDGALLKKTGYDHFRAE
jgi:thiamine-monophosphate kinase